MLVSLLAWKHPTEDFRNDGAQEWLGSHLFGSLTSLVLAGLFVAGYLPGYERAPFLKVGRTSYLFSVWGLLGGTLTAIMTLFCWQRRTLVFVDVICINQADPSLKAEALLSMGACLQSSESLHVFGHETFVQRLWCIFEAPSLQTWSRAWGGAHCRGSPKKP